MGSDVCSCRPYRASLWSEPRRCERADYCPRRLLSGTGLQLLTRSVIAGIHEAILTAQKGGVGLVVYFQVRPLGLARLTRRRRRAEPWVR